MPCLDDNELAAFADGALSPDEIARAQRHLDECATCRAVAFGVANPEAAAASVDADRARGLGRGCQVSRYTLIECVGRGGMGEVWAAFDPDLDRKVALKLLRPGLPNLAAYAERLRREAQAMARVNHPNVVTAFEVGVDAEHVFIAMEFVAGVTLRSYLETPRRWGELKDVFAAALEGIAAAHAVGIVHRDFKPENVLIGRDGRVRVADFGLAHVASGGAAAGPHASVTGLAGTPRYMAPEQFNGGPVDERTDQFSFAVVLWEAVHGEHPFAGTDAESLATAAATRRSAVTRGPRQTPSGRAAPKHVQAALTRALSAAPNDRFPSMQALLRALAHDPRRTRRRRLAAVIALVSVVVMGAGAVELSQRLDPCRAAARSMEATWDPAVRETLRQRFASTGLSYAAATFESFARHLDQYAAAWSAMRTQACAAIREAGTRSEAALDRRMICLDSRRASARALVELFTESTPQDADAVATLRERVEQAVQAAGNLPPLATCADEQALLLMQAVPVGEEARRKLGEAQAAIARAEALSELREYDEALAVAESSVAQARELAYGPLTARAFVARGLARQHLDDFDGAKEDLESATVAAAGAGDDETAASVWVSRTFLTFKEGRYEEGLLLARIADAALLRAGDPAYLRSSWFYTSALLLARPPHYEEALAHLDQALALDRASGEEDPVVLTAMASILHNLGRFDEALAVADASLSLCEATLGAEHPNAVTALTLVAASLNELGRTEEGLAGLELALERAERVEGPDAPKCGMIPDRIAAALSASGRLDEAVAAQHRAHAIFAEAYGPKHPNTRKVYLGLGAALYNAHRLDEALEVFESAQRELRERGDAVEPAKLADIEEGIAAVLRDSGRFAEALEHLERAVSLAEQSHGADSEHVASLLVALGETQVAAGRPQEGRDTCRRALVLSEHYLGADNVRLRYALDTLAKAELACGDAAAAVELAQRTVARSRAPVGRGSPSSERS